MATPAPSQFAALLRQSRFASFDPHIGQVYASYGGHAHRGNWGIKRPLPLRRRKGNVTVQAIDSNAQQTEWKSGERQSRWIEMWEEIGVTPNLANGAWEERLGTTVAYVRWDVDSEFGLATRQEKQKKPDVKAVDGFGVLELPPDDGTGKKRQATDEKKAEEEENTSEAIPNIHAMSENEFQRYLEKLRELRPAFLEFLHKRKNQGNKDSTVLHELGSLWQHRHALDKEAWKTFLMLRAFNEYKSHDSRVIEQQPQRYGGLVYARASRLQDKLLADPQPGRLLERVTSQGGSANGDFVASFAGMTPHLNKNLAENKTPLNWRSLGGSTDAPDAMRGATPFRMAEALLIAAPSTVEPKPQGLDSVTMEMEVYVPPETEHSKQNPYPPGSREYVGHQLIAERSMSQPPKRTRKFVKLVKKDPWRRDKDGTFLLSTLHDIVGKASTAGAKPPIEPSE